MNDFCIIKILELKSKGVFLKHYPLLLPFQQKQIIEKAFFNVKVTVKVTKSSTLVKGCISEIIHFMPNMMKYVFCKSTRFKNSGEGYKFTAHSNTWNRQTKRYTTELMKKYIYIIYVHWYMYHGSFDRVGDSLLRDIETKNRTTESIFIWWRKWVLRTGCPRLDIFVVMVNAGWHQSLYLKYTVFKYKLIKMALLTSMPRRGSRNFRQGGSNLPKKFR